MSHQPTLNVNNYESNNGSYERKQGCKQSCKRALRLLRIMGTERNY